MDESMELQIFVSYAHADDTVRDGATIGWVSCFVDNLRQEVGRYAGRPVKFWMDHRLEAHRTVDAELVAQIARSGILLAFMSKAYLRSEWCRLELTTFVREVGRGVSDDRVFIVEIDPTKREHWEPAVVRNLAVRAFWRSTVQCPDGIILGWPLPKPRDDADYYSGILNLARWIATRIDGIEVIGADVPLSDDPCHFASVPSSAPPSPEPCRVPESAVIAAAAVVHTAQLAVTATESVVASPLRPPRIVVHADRADEAFAAALCERLREAGAVVEAAAGSARPMPAAEQPQALQQQMAGCDGVLLVHARGPWSFIEARAADARRTLGGQLCGRWLGLVLLGGFGQRLDAGRDTGDCRVLECPDGLDDGLLKLYLQRLGQPVTGAPTVARRPHGPYPGLRPFQAEDGDIFFGRESYTAALLDILQRERFLAVVGPSGGGKSSLVRAGLQHGLQSGALDGVSGWQVAVLRPGDRPLHALAQALLGESVWGKALLPAGTPAPKAEQACDPATARLVPELRRGVDGLRQLRVQTAGTGSSGQRLLLLIDQFEEIFTYAPAAAREGDSAAPPQDVAAFVALLVALPDAPELDIYVTLTMRTDFYGHCTQHAGLAERINRSQYLLPRLSDAEMQAAICKPAATLGGRVDPAFAGSLIAAIGGNSDRLPLLQHALMRWWATAASVSALAPRIDASCCVDGDGVQDTLDRHAEALFARLSDTGKRAAEGLFRALTEQRGDAGEAVRRPQRLLVIAEWSGMPVEELRPVIEMFAASDVSFLHHGPRLVLSSVIDLTHEALMRQWRRLAGWVADEAWRGREYRRWSLRAKEYEEKKASLLGDADLARALDWWNPDTGQGDREPTLLWARRYSAAKDAPALYDEFTRLRAFLIDSRDEEARTHEDETRRLEEQATLERERADHERRMALRARRKTHLAALACLVAVTAAYVAFILKDMAEQEKARRTELLAESLMTRANLLARQEGFSESRTALTETLPFDDVIQVPRRHARNLLAGHVLTMGAIPDRVMDGTGAALNGGIVVSPDATLLAAAGERGTLVLFDAGSGRLLRRLEGHDPEANVTGAVFGIGMTPDGRRLYSADEAGHIRAWSLPDGTPLSDWIVADTGRPPAEPVMQAMALNRQGTRLVTGDEKGRLILRDSRNGRVLRSWQAHDKAIAPTPFALRFSPDGQRLASAGEDGTARLWNVADGTPIRTFTGHASDVETVAFSPDGTLLVSADDDGLVMLWKVDSDERPRVLRGHHGMVIAAVFTEDGRGLVTASRDNTLRYWDVATGVTLRVLQDPEAGIWSVALAGEHLYTSANDGTVRRWPLRMPGQQIIDIGEAAAWSAALAPDGQTLAVGMENGELRMYDLPAGTLRQSISPTHEGAILRIAFGPDGRWLATGSSDGAARLWRLDDPDRVPQPPHPLHVHQNGVQAVAFSADGRRLATAGGDGRIGLFSVDSGQGQTYEAHDGRVASVAFDASGAHLLSAGSSDGRLRLWLTANPETPPQELLQAQDALTWASLRPDGRELVSVGRAQVITVFDPARPESQLHFPGHAQTVYRAIYSPDGRQLATVSSDLTVRFWDLASSRLLFTQRLPAVGIDEQSPLWDFDFRCFPEGHCLIAVPLRMGRVVVYRLPYENPPPELAADTDAAP